MLTIPALLAASAAQALVAYIADAEWVDGNVTSGGGSALAKRNRQLPQDSAVAVRARQIVQAALAENATFLAAAPPSRIFPPLFNRYGVGDGFGLHVDNAIRVDPATGTWLRTDLSATLFLSGPASYDGGELIVTGSFGEIARAGPTIVKCCA